MRLYPRYTVTDWHGEGGSLYYVVDAMAHDGEQPAVLHTYRNDFKAAQDKALELERLICSECGLEPRAVGTSECMWCYVEGKL